MKEVDISVEPGDIEFKVWADGELVTVRSVQAVTQYDESNRRQLAYLLYVDRPKDRAEKYHIFRIEAVNKAYGGEKGECVYFYEMPGYKEKPE